MSAQRDPRRVLFVLSLKFPRFQYCFAVQETSEAVVSRNKQPPFSEIDLNPGARMVWVILKIFWLALDINGGVDWIPFAARGDRHFPTGQRIGILSLPSGSANPRQDTIFVKGMFATQLRLKCWREMSWASDRNCA
jgi:hypothetical protein